MRKNIFSKVASLLTKMAASPEDKANAAFKKKQSEISEGVTVTLRQAESLETVDETTLAPLLYETKRLMTFLHEHENRINYTQRENAFKVLLDASDVFNRGQCFPAESLELNKNVLTSSFDNTRIMRAVHSIVRISKNISYTQARLDTDLPPLCAEALFLVAQKNYLEENDEKLAAYLYRDTTRKLFGLIDKKSTMVYGDLLLDHNSRAKPNSFLEKLIAHEYCNFLNALSFGKRISLLEKQDDDYKERKQKKHDITTLCKLGHIIYNTHRIAATKYRKDYHATHPDTKNQKKSAINYILG